ncbi:MAG: NAD(P)/FAD-dependent oxidoreductase [Rhizobacter sp.]
MFQRVVVAGSGFSGLWSALSAARAIDLAGKSDEIEIVVVSPSATLIIRPRLYEAVIANMDPDLAPLFDAVGVRHLAARIESIHADTHELDLVAADGAKSTLHYDKFVLATGSTLFQPPVPGLAEFAFNVDQLADAKVLAAHLSSLATRQTTLARNTVVVAGGGLTGIETAAEMPDRLRKVLGESTRIRVVVIEQSPTIGPDLGPVPRPVIEAALAECGVEIMTGTAVAAIDASGVTTTSGERIESATVVWTAGARAHPLAAQIPGEHDKCGRIHVDPYLRASQATDVFATGDVAHAATDDQGHVAVMSCQHALSLGRVAGHNAAAELVGLPLHAYTQPKYVTCLDLGSWGALYTEGWDRQICLTGKEGKDLKREINTKWIYPPAADRNAVFAIANPDHVIVP